MFAITPTDNKWVTVLKDHQLNSFVNFWTPTLWNIKNPRKGDRWYFLLKSPIRKIGGYGEIVEYKNMTPIKAWKEYGIRNGCETLDELKTKIDLYFKRNSKKYKGQKIDVNKHKIGCLILKNCEFWDEPYYIKTENFGIIIAKQVEKHKVFNQIDPFNFEHNNAGFEPLNKSREENKASVNQRRGQGKFKGDILKAYNNKCCVSGETCQELLDAAHLQEYLNEDSNHIQNGILLRVDLHRLYDNGLLYIDNNYKIRISPKITSRIYRKYHNKPILLPEDENDHPSIAALELKLKNFRK